ncbi:Helix-turn-helix domain-containing protein [Meinhardsimonia xiamenensis]|jgi:hypothetical protein|uniref:Helix-turn-helix domain-containing protein n=1 Tax=Meinhardsimonia xiamenensis TaxID=990712 RepID=A0A1G9E115_9RHOB|nr:helix-turn-helix domain-containing protein [Meinhardsimonia xiamenensis]PRX33969.1 helix-turn-helix protein [Meinhardsimonia xiamenensis]SDK69793.1 Helix-turn-helix domain-containing protein [Meinhardsimonia xiamenensis]
MSVEVASLIRRSRLGLGATAKAVAMYLADLACDDGGGIWAAKGRIAADLELSKRAVQTAMKALVDAGFLVEVGTRPCRNGATIEYRLAIEVIAGLPSTREEARRTDTTSWGEADSRVKEIHPSGQEGVKEIHPRGEGDSPHGVKEIHPNHPRTILEQGGGGEARACASNPPDTTSGGLDQLFDRVLFAAGHRSGHLPARWMPPAALLHVAGWRSLGLSDDEIVRAVTETQANYREPSRGPEAFDFAMKRFAEEKARAAAGVAAPVAGGEPARRRVRARLPEEIEGGGGDAGG